MALRAAQQALKVATRSCAPLCAAARARRPAAPRGRPPARRRRAPAAARREGARPRRPGAPPPPSAPARERRGQAGRGPSQRSASGQRPARGGCELALLSSLGRALSRRAWRPSESAARATPRGRGGARPGPPRPSAGGGARGGAAAAGGSQRAGAARGRARPALASLAPLRRWPRRPDLAQRRLRRVKRAGFTAPQMPMTE